MLTETQRKWLTEYLGECWHGYPYDIIGCDKCKNNDVDNRTFTTAQDKQDLLEKVIEKGEWEELKAYIKDSYPNPFMGDFSKELIQLSPLETAELVCKWKGVK